MTADTPESIVGIVISGFMTTDGDDPKLAGPWP